MVGTKRWSGGAEGTGVSGWAGKGTVLDLAVSGKEVTASLPGAMAASVNPRRPGRDVFRLLPSL